MKTKISDKNNLSLNSAGIADHEQWSYDLGLFLDRHISLAGHTNFQRIELAVRDYLSMKENEKKTIQEIKTYVKSLNRPDNEVYQKNELLIMSCFAKALEIIENNILR